MWHKLLEPCTNFLIPPNSPVLAGSVNGSQKFQILKTWRSIADANTAERAVTRSEPERASHGGSSRCARHPGACSRSAAQRAREAAKPLLRRGRRGQKGCCSHEVRLPLNVCFHERTRTYGWGRAVCVQTSSPTQTRGASARKAGKHSASLLW